MKSNNFIYLFVAGIVVLFLLIYRSKIEKYWKETLLDYLTRFEDLPSSKLGKSMEKARKLHPIPFNHQPVKPTITTPFIIPLKPLTIRNMIMATIMPIMLEDLSGKNRTLIYASADTGSQYLAVNTTKCKQCHFAYGLWPDNAKGKLNIPQKSITYGDQIVGSKFWRGGFITPGGESCPMDFIGINRTVNFSGISICGLLPLRFLFSEDIDDITPFKKSFSFIDYIMASFTSDIPHNFALDYRDMNKPYIEFGPPIDVNYETIPLADDITIAYLFEGLAPLKVPFYIVKLEDITIDGFSIMTENLPQYAIIDSGTTFTSVGKRAYEVISNAFQRDPDADMLEFHIGKSGFGNLYSSHMIREIEFLDSPPFNGKLLIIGLYNLFGRRIVFDLGKFQIQII
jgi:hypothetical protein